MAHRNEVAKSLSDRVDVLEEENNRLRKALLDPKEMILTMKEGIAELKIEHWAVKLLTASLISSLGQAPNFLGIAVGPLRDEEGGGLIEVTIQRVGGITPTQKLGKMRGLLERAVRDLAACSTQGMVLKEEIRKEIKVEQPAVPTQRDG